MPTPSNRQASTVLRRTGIGAGVLALSTVLASCSLFGATDDAAGPTQVAVASTQAPSASATITPPKEVAVKVMDLFARPEMPERRWFTDLLPYMTDDYADEAQYTDPARVPFDKVKAHPTASQDEHNPALVTVRFKTNDGPWNVVMVQDHDGAPWLVETIEPDAPGLEYTP